MTSTLLLRAPAILRAAGCEVVEFPGWQTRQRPGLFAPRAFVMHHDGSPLGPAHDAYAYAEWLFTVGRASEGIPAPLSQFWIDYYGRWWIGAAGRANHAGTGDGWGVIPEGMGNAYGVGIEMDNTTGEPTLAAQWEALHRGLPAMCTAFGWDPAGALTAHKEYARGRKFDPDDIAMPQLRADVIDLMRSPLPPPGPPPAPPEPEDDDMPQASTYTVPPAEYETVEDPDGGDPTERLVTDAKGWPSNAEVIPVPPPDGSGGVKFGGVFVSVLVDEGDHRPVKVWGERLDNDGEPHPLGGDGQPWTFSTRQRTRVDSSHRIGAPAQGIRIATDSKRPAKVLIEVDKP